MIFLKFEDFDTFINKRAFDSLIKSDITDENGVSQKLNDSERLAYGDIQSNLSARYDINYELGMTDEARNATLIKWMLSLTVYYLHNTVADIDIPERVIKNYDDARKDIAALASGKISSNLKTLMVEGKAKTKFRWGSSPKRNHSPY